MVGHAQVAELTTELRRESYHGLQVVAACVTGMAGKWRDRRYTGDR